MSITVLGTSHIAQQSIREIKQQIDSLDPDIIALELDTGRAQALLSKQHTKLSGSDIRQIGLKGYLFAKLGQYVQKKLGRIVGVAPGSEMKTALEIAKAKQKQIALIDQPIKITLQKFSGALTWKERGRFVWDIIKGLLFPKKQMKEIGLDQMNLTQVPAEEIIEKMTEQLKGSYPSIYQTLIDDRNKYMVRQLVRLIRKYPDKKILAIVGAGHKKGMEELLLKVDVLR